MGKNLLYDRVLKELDDITRSVPSLVTKGEPELLISLKFADGHIHTHFPNDEVSQELIAHILKEKGIVLGETPQIDPVSGDSDVSVCSANRYVERKIIFKHSRALGDGLMFTAGIRDFKLLFPYIRINVETNQKILFENNPYIDRTLKKGDPEVEFYTVGYPLGSINESHRHFAGMFFMDMVANVDEHSPLYTEDGKRFPLWQFCAAYANGNVGDPSMADKGKNAKAREPFISIREKYKKLGDKGFCKQCGDIHLSEEEKKNNLIERVYGFDKYWVVAPGGKRDCTAKVWDWRRFQEVINHFDGRIKFVVIGRSDHLVEKLDNVIDLTDKFNKDVRGLIPLVYHAEGCVSGPSFLNHLAAAVPPKNRNSRKPCVVIWGGREPSHWCNYTNHQMLHMNGVFDCCDNGGCWKARIVPLQKDPQHNKNLCSNKIVSEGKTIQACMHSITTQDVIRAIEKYYDGNIYTYSNFERKETVCVQDKKEEETVVVSEKVGKEINLLGNLNTSGGGEQSLVKIAEVLDKAGWKVNLHPWGSVHKNFSNVPQLVNKPFRKPGTSSFEFGPMEKEMRSGVPLLFYGNDCVWDFPKYAQGIVNKSSTVIMSINFMNGDLPKCEWLDKTGKLKCVVFQNPEKLEDWERQSFLFRKTKLMVGVGAIDLTKMLEVCPPEHYNGPFVILKHGKADARKYVTKQTQNKGPKPHIWQKHFGKELSTKFYSRLLKDTKDTVFEFMEAPSELVNFFKDEPRMVFHKWNAMPVEDFLSRGHLYLDHLSNDWSHSYPRTVGEAMAAGLPIICEPRDGQMDRVGRRYGDSGLLAVDYDEFCEGIRKFQRKEKWRQEVGRFNKDWARTNLRPEKWVEIIEDSL